MPIPNPPNTILDEIYPEEARTIHANPKRKRTGKPIITGNIS
jgi:hypothetical protein